MRPVNASRKHRDCGVLEADRDALARAVAEAPARAALGAELRGRVGGPAVVAMAEAAP